MKVINFEQRPCEKIRRVLDYYLSDELLIETNHEVLHHLETCKECSDALEARVRVRNALRQAVNRGAVPEGLEARIRGGIQANRPWRLIPTFQWAAAAAALVLLVLGGFGVLKLLRDADTTSIVGGGPAILGIGVRDHAECAVNHKMYTRRFTFEDMAGSLGPEYIGLVGIVRTNMSGEFDLVVAHKCHIKRREFAHFILRKGEQVLSLAVTPKGSDSFTKSDLVAALESAGIDLYQGRVGDYEVAGFESQNHLAFVVSNLRQAENLQIASNLAPKVNAFLNLR